VRLRVDIVAGHKTGFYLDQRDNRVLTRVLAAGRATLNCFCYSGAFSLQALAGGASSVLSIDSSGPALAMAAENLALNPHLDANRAEWREADVFNELRALNDQGRRFDLIILDPPKFAPSAGTCRTRCAGLSRHQRLRVSPAESRWSADELFVLGRHQR
jgi:23S rRNA (cytosine1962-C5)-methyltransferase